MKNLPLSVFNQGNIVGLGESSHGSKNEFEWKYTLILEAVKNNPNTQFVCYFEAYEDPLVELVAESIKSVESIEQAVSGCLKKMYSIWQTQETYAFLLELMRLMVSEKRDIQVVGIDYRSKEHKQSLDTQEMLKMRDSYMFENIKKSYQVDAVHFITAHNAHIGRYRTEDHSSIGYFLNQEFKDIYIPVAQYSSKGSVRVKWNGEGYQSVDFQYNSTLGSVTEFSNNLFAEEESIDLVVFETKDPLLENITTIEQIGFFLPLEEPWVMPFGKEYFDYVVLHSKSESAEPL